MGQLVGMSILQGGNGIPYLAREVYSYIITGKYSMFDVAVEDVPTGMLKSVIEEVNNEFEGDFIMIIKQS